MKTNAVIPILVALLASTTVLFAADTPEMPKPQKEHEWLQQFVGEWESEMEVSMDPSHPPVKATGGEKVRMLGDFWMVSEGTGTMEGMPPMKSVLTLGYDPAAGKYVGTWVDNMTGHLWHYQGTVDATGKVLTLESEGPCPTKPGLITKFRDVTEFKSKDLRVFTSYMQDEKGTWQKMGTGQFRRKS